MLQDCKKISENLYQIKMIQRLNSNQLGLIQNELHLIQQEFYSIEKEFYSIKKEFYSIERKVMKKCSADDRDDDVLFDSYDFDEATEICFEYVENSKK